MYEPNYKIMIIYMYDDTYIFTCQAYFYNALKKPMEMLWVFLEWLQNEHMATGV